MNYRHRSSVPLAPVLAVLAVACGDNGSPTDPDPLPPENCSPPNRSFEVVNGESIAVGICFMDPDERDVLTYTAQSAYPSVATAVIFGDSVRITGKLYGSTSVTVTATDRHGLTAVDEFQVLVLRSVTAKMTECTADGEFFGTVTIKGYVSTNKDLLNVEVDGFMNLTKIGSASISQLNKGRRRSFAITSDFLRFPDRIFCSILARYEFSETSSTF